MENKVFWVWLQSHIGFANPYKEIIDHFGTPEAVYNATEKELKECEFLKGKRVLPKKLLDRDLSEAQKTVELCSKHRIHVITPDSEYFPESLKHIPNPPAVLYVRGDIECLKAELPVAVIGSRTPCRYGEESARKIVTELVASSAVIVSGGALGIDSVAHRSAIDGGGKTLLVMGCGHGDRYLPENSELRKDVYLHGALISEYPPYTQVYQGSFPLRNRIISGLSKAVVIIEAAQYSGTFSTAKYAMKQGKALYVLPGDIESGNFAGSNQLITEGANPFFSANDIISSLRGEKRGKEPAKPKTNEPFAKINEPSSFSKRNKTKRVKRSVKQDAKPENDEKNTEREVKKLPETISKSAEIVYNLMSDGKCTMDEIANSSELTSAKILAALTELELEGIIRKTADAYSLI